MDGIIGGYLNTEKPGGSALVKTIFYIGIVYFVWQGLSNMWTAIMWFDNDWDQALWWLIKAPFIALFKLLMLRLGLDIVLALFSIRDDIKAERELAAMSE